jgi:uncharacterized protein
MEWLNEPPHWTLEGDDLETGILEIVTGLETDFWRVTHYGFTRDNGHAYLERAADDFVARVKFSGEYEELYDQAGLMIRLDENNWIKTGIELEAGKLCLSAVVTREFSDWSVIPIKTRPEAVWLRLERTGDAVRVDYALDGEHYEMLRLAYFPPSVPVSIGPMACSPKRAGFKAQFTNFKLEPR